MSGKRRSATPAFLVLENGRVFRGRSVGAPGVAFGEAVFTTAMSGYQEIATDPSYAEQIVCFTAPMIGNYGVAPERDESGSVAARAVLMKQAGGSEWCEWLEQRGVVALRASGAMRAAAVATEADPDEVLTRVLEQPRMAGRALAAEVSCAEPYEAGSGSVLVTVVDYGCKRSIVRRLVAAGARVRVVPHDATAAEILEGGPCGVVLANGPGDPAALPAHVEVVRELIGRVPILGICLGHQLLALALGYRTFKLPFGHRGANHPVLERAGGGHRVLVTCQNHGFAVEGDGPEVSHVSLYDGTAEGLSLPEERARSVQFHPEAGPGPHDGWHILDEWVEEVQNVAATA